MLYDKLWKLWSILYSKPKAHQEPKEDDRLHSEKTYRSDQPIETIYVLSILFHTTIRFRHKVSGSIWNNISNNPSFCVKHRGVLNGSDGSGGTSLLLTENPTRPVAQVTVRVAYIQSGRYYTMPRILETCCVVYYGCRSGVRLHLLCVQHVVTYMNHQTDMYVTLFAGVAVMLKPFTQRQAMFMPFFGR